MTGPLVVGAVAYTPNVVTIWEGMRDYFAETETPMDFVLYSNYGRLVDELIAGHVDLAWNTNLAYVRATAQTDGACRALASRDTDLVFRSVFVARAGSGFSGIEAVRGRRLALGSRDSAQAAILPVQFLREHGIGEDDVDLIRINSDVGKHGDTGRSELDALRAVLDERADAAAIGINTWEAISRGDIMAGALEAFWTSPEYSHCTFTAMPTLSDEAAQAWLANLYAMDWDNPRHREILELEGLRAWVPPKLDGYRGLFDAVADQGNLRAVVNHALVFDLINLLARTPAGSTVVLDVARGASSGEDAARNTDLIAAWCRASGNRLVEVRPDSVVVRHGRSRDVLADLDPDQLPGTRLWMYANFDCNLHCDYCCVKSSPQTERRALGADRVAQLAAEAVPAGVRELILTGGEPFLLNDIDVLVASCTTQLPTTLLTNGMLFKGARLERLLRMDRERLTLQISLDSATPQQHDSHRGRHAWDRAVAGIRLALDEGFDVKVAATLPAELTHEVGPFIQFLAELGIRPDNRVIRAVAHQGFADDGIELPVDSLIPEVTITADGVWWHPVSATDEAHLVQREIFPLADAIAAVRERFIGYRQAADRAADWFPCA